MKENGNMDLLMGGSAMAMPNKMTNDEANAAVKAYNDATDIASKMFNENLNRELEKSKKIKENSKNLEITPTNGYLLVVVYDKNPYDQIKLTDSGLILPSYNGKVKSQESGEEIEEDMAIKYASVIEVGPEVKYIKPGDDIIFRNHTQLPAPFLGKELWVVGQNNVIVVINEGLSERLK